MDATEFGLTLGRGVEGEDMDEDMDEDEDEDSLRGGGGSDGDIVRDIWGEKGGSE